MAGSIDVKPRSLLEIRLSLPLIGSIEPRKGEVYGDAGVAKLAVGSNKASLFLLIACV